MTSSEKTKVKEIDWIPFMVVGIVCLILGFIIGFGSQVPNTAINQQIKEQITSEFGSPCSQGTCMYFCDKFKQKHNLTMECSNLCPAN